MGTPFEVNSILKLRNEQGLPRNPKVTNEVFKAQKNGYRLISLDVPVPLVNNEWQEIATVIIHKVTWGNQKTYLEFVITDIKEKPVNLKSEKPADGTDDIEDIDF